MAVKEEKTIIGTELKYKFLLQSAGFDMDYDDFDILITCGSKKQEIAKEDCVIDIQGNFYFMVDTNPFKPGDLYATFFAYVPDTDAEDGIRTEKYRKKLTTLIN